MEKLKKLFVIVVSLLTLGNGELALAQEGAVKSKTITDFERVVRNEKGTRYVFVVPDHLSGELKIETLVMKPEEVKVKGDLEEGKMNWAFLAQTYRYGQIIGQGLIIYLHPKEKVEVLSDEELEKLEKSVGKQKS